MFSPAYRKVLPYVALLLCLVLTAAVWLFADNFNQASAQERYQYRTAQIITAITKRIEDYATVLRGGTALFAASDDVSRNEWKTYIEHLSIGDSFPGIQGVGFAKVIKPAELAQHIQQIRAEGFPDYTVRPEGERAEYTSIIYLEPFDACNQRAFGYDMASEPVRRTAMERARDTDTVSISGKVTLVQETEQDVQAGFLMYVPVYTNGMPHSNAESHTALQGYVYSPFRIRNLIRGIFPDPVNDIDLEIYDGAEVVSSTLMYDSDESGYALENNYTPLFSSRKIIDLYGHQWTLVLATLPPFELAAERYQSGGILAAGIMISLLAFLFVRGQENTRERALALAQEMTSALRQREEELRNSEAMWHGLVNANPESVLLTDLTGIVLAANETVAHRLGKDVQEMIGANYFDLLPPTVATERKARADQVISSGKPVRFEDNRAGRFIDNYIHPIFDSDGKLTRLAVLGIDITERKRAEEEIRQLNRELEQRVIERTEQLAQTVQSLQAEIAERMQAEEGLAWNANVNAAIGELSSQLLSLASLEDISFRVLEQAKRLTASVFGYVGYIDPRTGYLVCPTMTRDVWNQCQVQDKTIVFDQFGGLWGWVLENRQPLLTNSPADDPRSTGTPPGHILIRRFLSAPALMGDQLVGQIALANAENDYSARDLEVVTRLAALYAIAVQRERSQEELRKLTRAVEQSPVSIVITDTRGNIEYVNPKFTAVTGYTFAEALGNNPRILKSGDKTAEAYKQMWETIAAGREWRGEFHNKKKNGELYWESASIAPITNSAGVITHFVAVKEDITERKRAEEQLAASLHEKQVLLREIHHRVKNNLQVISSLLNLQAGGISDQRTLDVIQDSQTRVDAIALVHEKLYRSPDLARIDLNDYLQDLTAGLFSAYQASAKGIALRVNIPDVSFNLETAIPLGLVVTELLSNCLKYAFPPSRAGKTAQPTIQISVSLPPADADGCFTLSVRDNGVGLPQEVDVRHTETLGLQLVTTLVEQLAGQFESHSNGGTEFRITFREIQYKERS